MPETSYSYDESSDTLYIAFSPGVKATGVELNDHILLRINKASGEAIGLTFFEYSLLAQQTEIGPRGFPLTGLDTLADSLRDMVLDILARPPVSDILSLLAYTPSATETIPVTSLEPLSAIAA